jgi:hypothetical protein
MDAERDEGSAQSFDSSWPDAGDERRGHRSHALIWCAMGPQRKLGRGARTLFDRAERGQATT